MAAVVYVLCALTSLLCAALLLRGYRHHRARLLLWSGLCFVGLGLENAILLLDVLVFPTMDLWLPRRLVALAGLLLLLYGLIWDAG